jgi:hypothetical protein
MHAAQASDNVPARYDPVRLRRPTTSLRQDAVAPRGGNLSVTVAVPATEMISVAGAAPATASTAAPTFLRRPLRRLAVGSRPPTPRGSLPPFGWGPIDPYPAHSRSAFACSPILYPQPHRLTLRLASPCGRATGLPRCGAETAWVRSRLYAGGTSSAPGKFGVPGPGHLPFGPSLSAPLACPW